MAYFKINKCSSLNFRKPEESLVYIQKFALSDTIRVQYSMSYSSNSLLKTYLSKGDEIVTLIPSYLVGNYTDCEGQQWFIYEFTVENLVVGEHSVRILWQNETIAISTFYAMNTECLDSTILMTYTHRLNDLDAIFISGETQNIFQFRVEGGFKDSEVYFFVNNEIFRNQRYSLKQLAQIPYRKLTLTIGDNSGVPMWVGDKVNFIFSLEYIDINGKEYVRSESSTPQTNQLSETYDLYVYKMEVEEIDNFNTSIKMPKIKVLGTEKNKIIITDNTQAIFV